MWHLYLCSTYLILRPKKCVDVKHYILSFSLKKFHAYSKNTTRINRLFWAIVVFRESAVQDINVTKFPSISCRRYMLHFLLAAFVLFCLCRNHFSVVFSGIFCVHFKKQIPINACWQKIRSLVLFWYVNRQYFAWNFSK